MLRSFLLSGFVLFFATSASAAPIAFTGQFRLQFQGNISTFFAPVPVSGTGDISGGVLSLPAGFLSMVGATAVITYVGTTLTRITVTAVNRAGSFQTTSDPTVSCDGSTPGVCRERGHFSGGMLVAGMLAVLGGQPFSLELTDSTSAGFGQGGNVGVLPGPTLTGSAWTTGNVTVGSGVTGTGFGIEGTRSGAIAPGGSMTMVTPLYVNRPGVPDLLAVAELQLSFVPEPGTLVLLLTSVAFSIGLARRRRQIR